MGVLTRNLWPLSAGMQPHWAQWGGLWVALDPGLGLFSKHWSYLKHMESERKRTLLQQRSHLSSYFVLGLSDALGNKRLGNTVRRD